jgi:hypothetical protein
VCSISHTVEVMTVYAALKTPYIKYTGVNSTTSGTAATVIGRYPPAEIASQSIDPVTGDITLTGIYGQTLTIPMGYYVYGWGSIDDDRAYEPAFFETNYVRYTDPLPVGIQTATLSTAASVVALPALTLLSPNFTATGTWDKVMPSSITPADLHWRAITGASVLSAIQLQAVANPITVSTTGFTLLLRAVGVATVAGVVLVETQKLITT